MVAIKTLLDVFAALAALLGLAPVVPFLSPPVLLLGAGAVAGGLWCDRRGRYPLPPVPGTLLALAGVAYYAAQISRAEVALPVVHALVVLLAVRLLSAKQSRDYLQIFVLALFLLAGSSLLSLEIGFMVYLIALVIVVTVSLVLLTVFVTDPRLALPHRDLWRLLRVALILPAASLVLMLGFFVILPRTGQPLWNFLNPAGQAVAGLAESVSPGAFARLSTVKSLAFRAEGPELPPEERYWRALVLNQPQGSQWVRGEPPAEGSARLVGGQPVSLIVYPEPRSDRYLVTLDRPIQVSGVRNRQSPDQVFSTTTANGQRFRFKVDASYGADMRVGNRSVRDFYLVAPGRISARTAAAAAQIAASGPGSAERLAALASFFRDRRLTYAQENLPGGRDPVDAFLFDQKRGYCEYFAAAYATLARLAGIPTRLVGGYYGGEYNPLGGYYLVTDDTAHVWAEVLTDEGLWQRVDPSQWASNASTSLGAARAAGLGPLQRLTDTLNYFWVQAVVVYDLGRQFEIMRSVRHLWQGWRLGAPSVGVWGWLAAAIASGGLVLLVARRRRGSREARLLATLHARARARLQPGIMVESLGLSELAERLDSNECREFARIYQGAVFRDRALTVVEWVRLKALLKKL